MKTGTNLHSYPVFPDWVFEGHLELDNTILNGIIRELSDTKKSAGAETNFGWVTAKNLNLGPGVHALNKLVMNMFWDNVVPHYRLGEENRNVELTEAWSMSLKPGHSVPVNVERHRWYQAVVFLQSPENGANLFLDQFGAKLYATPVGVQPYTHYIESKQNKVVFFPSHIPWGFTPNLGTINTTVLCSSFIIKK